MKIEIKNRWDGTKIVICGEYESIKDCLERNKSANLQSADLQSADLRFANLRFANLQFADLQSADLRSADLQSADLRFADLQSADLRFANLRSADLRSANLRSAKGYADSHEFFAETIRQQKINLFNQNEWFMIGQILVHRLCWYSIQKRYGEKIVSVFAKLTAVGFDEWQKKYVEILKAKE
jgi:hypothetical protein